MHSLRGRLAALLGLVCLLIGSAFPAAAVPIGTTQFDPARQTTGFTIGDGSAPVVLTLHGDSAGATSWLRDTTDGLTIASVVQVKIETDTAANFVVSGNTTGSDNAVQLPLGSIGSDEIAVGSIGRTQIAESLLSTQTHATDCTVLTCDAGSDGEQCFEQDANQLWVCDGSGSPAWVAIGGGGSTTGTTNSTWTIDDYATGTEPADGAGLIIEGGSGDVGIRWDATNNEIDFSGPAGTRVSFPDPGDGSRTLEQLDNTSEPSAPASGTTTLYPLGGEWYKKDNGDGTSERLIYNSGNYGVISRTVTPFVLNGDDEGTTRTTVWSYALPDGTLGTTREIRVTLTGTYINSGTTGVLTPFLVFGGTTWWSDADTNIVSSVQRPIRLEFTIRNTTDESTQVNDGWIVMNHQSSGATTGSGIWSAGSSLQAGNFRGTSAIATASGGSDTIAIDFQLPNTESTCILQIDTVKVELL